jgi:hypothetical protein
MRLSARTPSASLLLALALAVPAAAQTTAPKPAAQADGKVLSDVEAMTSTVMQKNQTSFSGIAARVRLRPPQLIRQISVMPNFEYWRARATIEDFDIEAERRDATLGVDGRYDFDAGTFQPYVGIGFAMHFLTTEVDAPALGLSDQSTALMKGGLTFLGGASFLITERFGNFMELKYHHVTDHEQLKINFGLSYRL